MGHVRYINNHNLVVLSVSKSLLGTEGQKEVNKFVILSWNPRSHVRVLIYRTWQSEKDPRHKARLAPRFGRDDQVFNSHNLSRCKWEIRTQSDCAWYSFWKEDRWTNAIVVYESRQTLPSLPMVCDALFILVTTVQKVRLALLMFSTWVESSSTDDRYCWPFSAGGKCNNNNKSLRHRQTKT